MICVIFPFNGLAENLKFLNSKTINIGNHYNELGELDFSRDIRLNGRQFCHSLYPQVNPVGRPVLLDWAQRGVLAGTGRLGRWLIYRLRKGSSAGGYFENKMLEIV